MWEKYRSLFPSDHFILECKAFDNRRSEICLINTNKFSQIMGGKFKGFSIYPWSKNNTHLFR